MTSLITDKSRVIFLDYFDNPTGAVLSYGEIDALAGTALERDLIVISDEVYERMFYIDGKHRCLATFPGMHGRTLVANSFSKNYAMISLRVDTFTDLRSWFLLCGLLINSLLHA